MIEQVHSVEVCGRLRYLVSKPWTSKETEERLEMMIVSDYAGRGQRTIRIDGANEGEYVF